MSIIDRSSVDPNKILPMTHQWARKHYKESVANNWVPEEIPMQDDVEQWRSDHVLSKAERKLILYNLGFFSTAESLTANNIVLALYRHITNPECRQYMLRQAYEEAIHTDTFVYCCDTLAIDPDEIYGMYETIPSIKEKDAFVVELTQAVLDPNFSIVDLDSLRRFINDLVGFYVIMEGIFFYAGFAMMLALKRKNKMVGIGEQFEFIMRDESMHLSFGCQVINTLKEEQPEVWSNEFQNKLTDLIKRGVEYELIYAQEACPEGIVGVKAEEFGNYVRHIADRRLERIGLPEVYGVSNPFPWMSQSTDLAKEKNFFETRVTEYQTGSLDWD